MNVDTFSLGLGLPTPHLILEDIIERAFHTHSAAALFGGGGLLAFGFLWRVIQEKVGFIRGVKDPDYLGHVLTLIGCIALLSVYEPVVRGITSIVSQLGRGLSTDVDLSGAFAARAQAFGQTLLDGPSASFMSSMSPLGFIHAVLQTLTAILYGLVSWAVFALRCFQTFLLGVIIAYGPICIGFAFLGGIFGHLALAWFWALVEVSAWGLTLDVLNFVFTPLAQDVPKHFYLITELGLCLTLLLLIRAVPQTTSMLLRNQSASFGAGHMRVTSALAGISALQRSAQTFLRATPAAPPATPGARGRGAGI